MSQVITIHPDGLASGLQHKRGKGLDLRELGPVSITRVSLVEWSESSQAWFVRFIAGPRKGQIMTFDESLDAGICPYCPVKGTPFGMVENVAMFDDYGIAVEAEVAVLDSDRLNGLS